VHKYNIEDAAAAAAFHPITSKAKYNMVVLHNATGANLHFYRPTQSFRRWFDFTVLQHVDQKEQEHHHHGLYYHGAIQQQRS